MMDDNPFNIQEGFCRISSLLSKTPHKQILFPDEVPFSILCSFLIFYIQRESRIWFQTSRRFSLLKYLYVVFVVFRLFLFFETFSYELRYREFKEPNSKLILYFLYFICKSNKDPSSFFQDLYPI